MLHLLVLGLLSFAPVHADHHEHGKGHEHGKMGHGGEMHKEMMALCAPVKTACEAAGFTMGGGRKQAGKGLIMGCLVKLSKGEKVEGVAVDPADAQYRPCFDKMKVNQEKRQAHRKERKERRAAKKAAKKAAKEGNAQSAGDDQSGQ